MSLLQSSTEQWGVHLARINAAVHRCWITAHLSEQQIFIGAVAVTQGCCEPVLQSSTEQCGVHLARTNAAVHCCWVTAHLSEQQIFIGANAVTHALCLFWRATLSSGGCILPEQMLRCIAVGSQGCCEPVAELSEKQIFIGAIPGTKGCFVPALQSITEQWGLHLARTSAAVHWFWVTAQLYQQQVFNSVTVLTQGCCEPVAEQH